MPKYAHFDPAISAPHPVTGWFDTDLIAYPSMPPATDLLEVTSEQWQGRLANPSGWQVQAGSLEQAPTPAPSLATGPRHVPLATIRQRVQAAGEWHAFCQRLDGLSAAQRWHLLTQADGVASDDADVTSILQAIGCDPAAILS